MQKKKTKRLTLEKLTVAVLSTDELRSAGGARPNPTVSACMLQCCTGVSCAGACA